MTHSNHYPNLLIVAAGKGSRMGDVSVPKALADVGGKPNLINTIIKLYHNVDDIYVAVSSVQYEQFQQCLKAYNWTDSVRLIVIPSGLGSGHAVMHAMSRIKQIDHKQLLITWGDVYFDSNALVKELTDQKTAEICDTSDLVIPCAFEQHPYLTISVDEDMSAKGVVLEPKTPGFHDQSVFLCTNTKAFYKILQSMHHALWNVDHYITANGEFGFLQIVPFMHNIEQPATIYETDNTLLGYNTQEELAKIVATK